jgi:hypothetical protein
VLNTFHPNWLIAIGVVLIFSFIASGIIHTWQKHKLRGNGQRAVARLTILKHGSELEPAEVETLLQEIFEPEGRFNPIRAMEPTPPPQVASKVHKSLNGKSPELDEVDALVKEILEDQGPLKAEQTPRPEPLLHRI